MKYFDMDSVFGGKVNLSVFRFLFVITLLGGLLRVYHINYQSLWLDELHSIIPAHPENSLASIIEYCKSDQPPAFFLYLHFVFKLFPYNEMTGRLATMFIGILSIPVMYFLGKEFKSKEVGLMASFITAINYFHLYYSQDIRFYPMIFLLASLSYLFFVRAFKYLRAVDFVFYVIFTSTLLYTHYYGMFIVFAQALTFIVLLYYRRDTQFLIGGFLAGVAIVLSFIPWMPTVWKDMDIPAENFWIKEPKVYFVAEYFYDYTGKDAFTAFVWVCFISFFIKGLRAVQKQEDKGQWALSITLLMWIVLCYLVPYIRSITSTPILHNRYTIVVLPAWFVLFALGWNEIGKGKWRYTLPVLLFLASVINLLFVRQHYSKIKKDQFRECSEYVIKENVEQYPLYSSVAWHFNFYFLKQDNKVDAIHEGAYAQKRLWLLQAHFFGDDQKMVFSSFEKDYVVIKRKDFYGAAAILLEHR